MFSFVLDVRFLNYPFPVDSKYSCEGKSLVRLVNRDSSLRMATILSGLYCMVLDQAVWCRCIHGDKSLILRLKEDEFMLSNFGKYHGNKWKERKTKSMCILIKALPRCALA